MEQNVSVEITKKTKLSDKCKTNRKFSDVNYYNEIYHMHHLIKEFS